MIAICFKQHLNNIFGSIQYKVKQHRGCELKRGVACKKARIKSDTKVLFLCNPQEEK